MCFATVIFIFSSLFLLFCFLFRRVVQGVNDPPVTNATSSATDPSAASCSNVTDEANLTLSAGQLANLINDAVARAVAQTNNSPPSESRIGTNISASTGFVARVAFKPPQPLFHQNPNVWFEILEQQFTVAEITVETTKYAHAVGALDARLHDTFAYLITGPKGNTPYTTFKTEVIRVLGESEKTKLNNLMHGLTLGDRKPSQLLSTMKLNAGNNFNEATLRQLWMKRLPQTVQMVLTPFENDVSLSVLAERADNLHETMMQSQINAVETSVSCNNTNNNYNQNQNSLIDQKFSEFRKTLLSEISEIVKQNSRSRSSSNSRSRLHSRSNSRNNYSRQNSPNHRNFYYGNPSEENNFICYYHYHFGSKALKCKPNCKFVLNNSSDNNVPKN